MTNVKKRSAEDIVRGLENGEYVIVTKKDYKRYNQVDQRRKEREIHARMMFVLAVIATTILVAGIIGGVMFATKIAIDTQMQSIDDIFHMFFGLFFYCLPGLTLSYIIQDYEQMRNR